VQSARELRADHDDAVGRKIDRMGLSEATGSQPVDVRAGSLHFRLARTKDEVDVSQKLRYRVFCEEMAARPTDEMTSAGREFVSFDAYCDHLVEFDDDRGKDEGSVVGTCRLMRREFAVRRLSKRKPGC
jgi:putative hemolysin